MEEEEKITIHQIFWYFLIFSVLGLIAETIYCYISVGVLESRKGFIWGPLCPVYGVCGAALIYVINKLKCKKVSSIFIAGFILGSIGEYILSYVLEAIYGIRFWNYDYLKLNINGRISVIFSIYWGVLSVFLMKLAKPLIDKFINKMKPRTRNIWEIGLFIFLVIDCLVTIWGIQTYQNRVVYNKVYETKSDRLLPRIRKNIEDNYFTNEKMSITFPNLRVKTEDGEEVWIKTLIDK